MCRLYIYEVSREEDMEPLVRSVYNSSQTDCKI